MNKRTNITRVSNGTKAIITCMVCLSLAACIPMQTTDNPVPQNTSLETHFKCADAQRFANRVIGDGHCVSLIKHCSGAPNTRQWRPGPLVLGNEVPEGAIIATFNGLRYPSKHGYHAAIYIKQDNNGIWVWDQWQGKAVHKRLIRIRHDGAEPSNTAQAYRVVEFKSDES